ncbi:hypothetical protein NDU88_000759 [Pleurodeles waltl]|uniref:Uncharacterized protein n=1 Tax=Pleurodeles waltl TaxID=8319 RepID=A0AAV7NCA2_PLEWA|nr:hypothetical protein NDU88_000759 [Pleurodeles waltl]
MQPEVEKFEVDKQPGRVVLLRAEATERARARVQPGPLCHDDGLGVLGEPWGALGSNDSAKFRSRTPPFPTDVTGDNGIQQAYIHLPDGEAP